MGKRIRRASEIILGDSEPIRGLRSEIEALARGPLHSVLVIGETGTGKDLVPRALAACAPNWPSHVETFNCPAIPVDHLESELFGTTRGAFPSALDRAGAAERAAGGVLFLDEIAAMPVTHQGKILRLLESGEGRRLGASHTYRTDAIVVAATNEDLRAAVTGRAFREDLYYRLVQDAVLVVPPLREHAEDIPFLAEVFLAEIDSNSSLEPAALLKLATEPWPGNVRQLRAVVRSAARLAGKGRPVGACHVDEALERLAVAMPTARRDSEGPKPSGGVGSGGSAISVREVPLVPKEGRSFYTVGTSQRRGMLVAALRAADGNQTEAGLALGLHTGRHGKAAASDRQARRLAERKFRYWWKRLVEPGMPRRNRESEPLVPRDSMEDLGQSFSPP